MEASGQSLREFACAHRLKVSTLRWWRSRLRQPVEFLKVEVTQPSVSFLVHLGRDLHVEVPPGFDAAELRRLVDALC
jgi:hypothetical protein